MCFFVDEHSTFQFPDILGDNTLMLTVLSSLRNMVEVKEFIQIWIKTQLLVNRFFK